MKTATLIKDDLPNFNGHAALYRFDPPLQDTDWEGKPDGDPHEFVVVSAVCGWAHETYLFPADADGNITNWGELDGSTKNTTSHAEAIQNAGYAIA